MSTPKYDDWKGTQNALGSIHDKSVGLSFALRPTLSREVLAALYRQVPTVATVVDRIVDDSFRNGWKLTNVNPKVDLDGFRKRLNGLGGLDRDFDDVFKRAAKWARLFGGSVILMPTEDEDPKRPMLRPDRLFPLVVEPAYNAQCLDFDSAFGSSTYQRVLWYDITNQSTGTLKVHHTRVVPFEAVDLPPDELTRASVNGWGPSVIERLFDDLARAGSARQHAVAQMYVASLLVLHMAGFREDSKVDPEATRSWLSEFHQRLSGFGIAALDKEDLITTTSLNQSGNHELIDKMHDALGAAAGMPREILFRESPAGLNAGELTGPQEIWFADVDAWRQGHLSPRMLRVIKTAARVWKIDLGEDVGIEWNPLWTKSEEKTATVAKMNAETDSLYFQNGAVSSSEIREHRLVKGSDAPLSVTAAPPPVALDLTSEDVPAEVTPTDEGPKPQDEALNGAQIASLLAIVEKVQAGLIPRDAAIEIVRASFPAVRSPESVLGSAGVAVAAPAGAPSPDVDEAGPSMDPPPEDLISPREAGQRFGVPTATISARMRNGELSWWGLGHQRRVSLAEVAKLAKAHETPEDDKIEETP